jgi:hypothetical protein
VRAKVGNREQAVAELVASDDPWRKSCGAYAIGTFAIKSLEVELGKCLEHPHPLLRETTRAAKRRLEGTRRELLNLRGLIEITHAPEPPPIRRKKLALLHSSGA